MKTKRIDMCNSLINISLMAAVVLALRLASAQCDPPPSGLVAWWPGEGNANDIVGTNNGVAQGSLTYTAGEIGQAFSFDGSSATVFCPASASLNVGTNAGFSIECWIKPADISSGRPLAEWNSGSAIGSHFWISDAALGGSSPGSLFANLVDTNGTSHIFASSPGLINTTTFQHVALTYGQSSGIATLYDNGIVVATQSLGTFIPQTTYGFYIGRRPAGGSSRFFTGLIDEMTVYKRALSSNEIATIYAAGSAGKCRTPFITSQPQSQVGYWGQSVQFSVAASPISPPLSYLWQSNGVAISGATNQTLTLTNLQNSFAAGYTVVVSNSYGSVTSSPPANLVINPAGVAIALYPGVKIDGVVGYTYGIQYSANLADTNSWIGLTNLTFTQPTEIWYDSIPASLAQRFYRVLQGPIPIP